MARENFRYGKLMQVADKERGDYERNAPFPHVVVDGAVFQDRALHAARSFPDKEGLAWFEYENPFERKRSWSDTAVMPEPLREILHEMNGIPFLSFLENLTGIKDLVPDDTFYGAGLYRIDTGGKLDIHADFTLHPKTKLERRLNVILYLTLGWKPEYGGALELWNGEMTECVRQIGPQFNRLLIFSPGPHAFHGHPEPWSAPEDVSRISLAASYYVQPRGRTLERKASFKNRPQDPDDPELDRLRSLREKQRI